MAAPETTNNVTVRKLTSLMSQLWTKIKNALQEKQDDLGISSSGDTGKFLNEQGDWAAPEGTAQLQSDWNQATTTAKDYIKNKPTLGTAAAKDVPASGDASTTQVVMGSDSRLSDARPASDVSAWAKAATKPTYTALEVGVATASQGTKADTAVQPDDVARTGYVNVPGGQYLCFRLDNSSPLRYGSIAILSSHQAYQILDLLSFAHENGTDPLTNMSLRHVSGGKEEYQKSKVYWKKTDSFSYIFFYFGNNSYHRVSYILTGNSRNASNIGIYATTDGLPSGTTELTSETYVPRISGTAGTAVGATNQPVYVADNGAIKACNIFYA